MSSYKASININSVREREREVNKCILDIEKLEEFQTILRVSKITVSWSNELQSKKTLMKYCRELVGGRDITSCSYSNKKNIWCDV